MRPPSVCLLAASFGLLVAGPARGAAPAAPILPLTSVRLYETGVGYFSRSGRLDGALVGVAARPGRHLDDALKTLVVLSGDSREPPPGRRVRIEPEQGDGAPPSPGCPPTTARRSTGRRCS